MTRILGIESTCDETGVAIVDDGRRIVANKVLSQIPLHERFGGVVPEIASRAHVECITTVIESTLAEAGMPLRAETPGAATPPPVDAIAVAYRPGLVGSLLVGITTAKCLALAWDLPLIGVDHIHAHIYAATMGGEEDVWDTAERDTAELLPAVSLVVSGGHTSLYLTKSWTSHELLGSTTDDAVGEAFDKVASILDLGYPGGPAISRVAESGNRKAVTFKRSLMAGNSLDFSFSGIKTAVLYYTRGQNAQRDAPIRPEISVPDVAASFEETVVSMLVDKLARALRREGGSTAIVGGGVAANRRLRTLLDRLAEKQGYRILYPPPALCTDNAAMIAGLGYWLLEEGEVADLTLDADPVVAR